VVESHGRFPGGGRGGGRAAENRGRKFSSGCLRAEALPYVMSSES
jgi:hypothetical protein